MKEAVLFGLFLAGGRSSQAGLDSILVAALEFSLNTRNT